MPNQIYKRAKHAIQAVRALKNAALEDAGVPKDQARSTNFDLQFPSNISPAELTDYITRLSTQFVADQNGYNHSHLYCYACSSNQCEHSRPTETGQVFTGYTQTGTPVWQELFQYLLQLDDTRTDLLFKKKPRIISRVIGRKRLIEAQSPTFGKNSLTYYIIGQLVAGYFPAGTEQAALTIQIVETKNHRLHLQLITVKSLLEQIAETDTQETEHVHTRLQAALNKAHTSLDSINASWQADTSKKVRKELTKRCFDLLKNMAKSIERTDRQNQRRTRHAQQRAEEARPVHKAHEDLLAASQQAFMTDRMKNSIIVMGKGSRTHVFNEEGHHITSFILGHEDLERRQRRKRYLPLSPEKTEEFRKHALNLVRKAAED